MPCYGIIDDKGIENMGGKQDSIWSDKLSGQVSPLRYAVDIMFCSSVHYSVLQPFGLRSARYCIWHCTVFLPNIPASYNSQSWKPGILCCVAQSVATGLSLMYMELCWVSWPLSYL